MRMKVRESFNLNPIGNTNKYTDYINYIDTASVNAGSLSAVALLNEDFPSRAQRLVRKGDILYSSVRPNLRHYYLYNDDYNHAVASTGFVLLRNKSNYNTRFVFYYLSTKEVVRHLSNIAELSQSTFPSFSPKDLGKIDLPDIERVIQDRIASVLYAYDNLIEVNNKRIKALEQMAENLYKEWFVRFRFPGYETAEFENGIPKGWDVTKVKKIVKRLPFGTLYKEEDTEKEGRVIVIDQSQADSVGFHNYEPSHIATKDKPIALFGDHSCKQQLMITPFSLSENVIPFVGKQDIKTMYLFYLTRGIVETTEYKRHWSEFTAKKVLVAPTPLQAQFVSFVVEFRKTIQKLEELNRNLIKQRDLLLPRLMSGKLEV